MPLNQVLQGCSSFASTLAARVSGSLPVAAGCSWSVLWQPEGGLPGVWCITTIMKLKVLCAITKVAQHVPFKRSMQPADKLNNSVGAAAAGVCNAGAGFWLPGGGVDLMETLSAAAHRCGAGQPLPGHCFMWSALSNSLLFSL